MSAASTPAVPSSFAELGLPPTLVAVLAAVGYEAPSPIQAATIPPLMEGRDVLGMAQTGTGKTAAFALPVLARVNLGLAAPQALVLTPTRELAIQVAEAFQRYAATLPGFRVLPIYGGQHYQPQLSGLRRGVHVVVGTPGRVRDHLTRGTLKLDQITTVVLDEADEMLKMGFADEVDFILQQAPKTRQVALFSATMPTAVRRIAQTHLRDPAEITIASKTRTAADVKQRYWLVSGAHKMEAVTRILEAEPFDAMIVFSRTKAMTTELAEKLQARGFSAAALNGDMPQNERERTVARLKDGSLDIIVATDVAARGLDVERISHVLNYDIPTDSESYIHRIGRTGRAGRSGEAIVFVAPRERGLLRVIERATRQPITEMRLPTLQDVYARREARFRDQVLEAVADDGHGNDPRPLLESIAADNNLSILDVAAALARLVRGPAASAEVDRAQASVTQASARGPAARERPRRERPDGESAGAAPVTVAAPRPDRAGKGTSPVPPGMVRYRVEVGYEHQLRPGQLVGAIANEADLDSQYIGRIDIFDDYTHIDLPEGMPPATSRILAKAWVCGRQLRLRPADAPAPAAPSPRAPRPPRAPGGSKPKSAGPRKS